MACTGMSKTSVFIWFIENFRYCAQKKEEALYSPVFKATDNSEWCLRLHPTGFRGKDAVAFHLQQVNNSYNSKIHTVYSFLGTDGKPLQSKTQEKDSFGSFAALGTTLFLQLDELLKRKSEFLPQGTLTVCCRIRHTEFQGSITSFARTRIGIKGRSFMWTINKFSCLRRNQKTVFLLAPTSKQMPTLALVLYLSVDDEVILEITCKRTEETFLSVCEIAVLDCLGEVVDSKEDKHWFEPNGQVWKFPFLTTKAKLAYNQNLYLPNDTLSLRCNCVISAGVVSNKIEDYRAFSSNTADFIIDDMDTFRFNSKYESSDCCFNLAKDLQNLYLDGTLSDMKLRTNTQEFGVHKSILCARSPVFRAMLETDMKEKENNCIVILDVDDDILKMMLLYLYTDIVGDLQLRKALKLYSVADKYSLIALKNMCSSVLKNGLKPSNACDILTLADMHYDVDLKIVVQEFIVQCGKEVFCLNEWASIMKSMPQLALDTMLMKCIRE